MKLINSIKKRVTNLALNYYHYFKNYTIYVPNQGLGDILILFFALRKRKEKYPNEKYLFVVFKKYFKDLCNILGVESFYTSCLPWKSPKHIIRIFEKTSGEAGANKTFEEALASYLDIPNDFEMDNPPSVKMNPKIEKMFDGDRDFIKGKSVLICPHATTFKQCFDRKLWINWADELTKKGYKVVFNSSEKFSNYPSMLLNISDTINFLNLAGNLLAYRSGLADVLVCFCNAKNVVIYPRGGDLEDMSLKKWFPKKQYEEFIYYEGFNPVKCFK